MPVDPSQLLTVGRIGPAYGVRGWVTIHSYTAPPETLFEYRPWYLKSPHGPHWVEVLDWQRRSRGPIAQLAGYNDREAVQSLGHLEIQVDKAMLPALEPGDYYWHQLEGLGVVTTFGNRRRALGRVTTLIETGANDVLVVLDPASRRERLIPYLPGRVVKAVDLDAGQILVDWDPDF